MGWKRLIVGEPMPVRIRDGVLYDERVLSDGCHATSGADKGDSHRAC